MRIAIGYRSDSEGMPCSVEVNFSRNFHALLRYVVGELIHQNVFGIATNL